jgi:hypothetical protein
MEERSINIQGIYLLHLSLECLVFGCMLLPSFPDEYWSELDGCSRGEEYDDGEVLLVVIITVIN